MRGKLTRVALAALLLLASGAARADGELHIFNWGDYTNPKLIDKFEKAYNVKVTLDDQTGQEQFICETPAGQKLTLKDGPGNVIIEDSNGNSIKLETSGVTITASAKLTINAGTIAISAGMVTVDAGMSKFSGVVQADTVISTSYTPGAGNIW